MKGAGRLAARWAPCAMRSHCGSAAAGLAMAHAAATSGGPPAAISIVWQGAGHQDADSCCSATFECVMLSW